MPASKIPPTSQVEGVLRGGTKPADAGQTIGSAARGTSKASLHRQTGMRASAAIQKWPPIPQPNHPCCQRSCPPATPHKIGYGKIEQFHPIGPVREAYSDPVARNPDDQSISTRPGYLPGLEVRAGAGGTPTKRDLYTWLDVLLTFSRPIAILRWHTRY